MRRRKDMEAYGGSGRPGGERELAQEHRVVIPLVDETEAGRIYDRSIHRVALAGGLVAAAIVGVAGWMLADGVLTVAGLGQIAAAGRGPAAVVGAGVGAALGGLLGALAALYRFPPRRP